MHKIPSTLLAFAFICVSSAAFAQHYQDNPNSPDGIPGSANPVNKSINGSMNLYPSNAEEVRRPGHTAPAKNVDQKHGAKHAKKPAGKHAKKTGDSGSNNK